MEWRQHRLTLSVRPNTPRERRAEILEAWYRAQLRATAEPLVELWQKRLDVRLTSLFVRRMRTRWEAATLRLAPFGSTQTWPRSPPIASNTSSCTSWRT